MSNLIEKINAYANVIALVSFILCWVLSNIWKFSPPKTKLGYWVLRAITFANFTAWDAWGRGTVRRPLPEPEAPVLPDPPQDKSGEQGRETLPPISKDSP